MNEKELLEMAAAWQKAAQEILEKAEPASRTEFAGQMLLCCADMIVWKVREGRGNLKLET